MPPYLGDFPADQAIYFMWNTFDAAGASVTRSADGVVSVYKDNSDGSSFDQTQVTTGITNDEDVDTPLTGVHSCCITTTNEWYETGHDYVVVLSASTIDGQTVNAVLAHFSIENRSEQTTLAAVAAGADVLYVASGFTLTDGTVIGATPYTNTSSDNGSYYVVQMEADNDTNIDVRLEFAMGANRIATEVGINGYFDAAAVRAVQVYAYNYTTSGWDKLSSATSTTEMRHDSSDNDYLFVLSPAHTDGAGGTAGDVEIRFYSDGDAIDEDDLYLDYVYVNGASTGGASPQAIAAAVHDELDVHFKHIPMFTGDIYYVDGTSGDDGNTGSTPTQAFAKIATGITAAGAGGMVKVFAGTYSEAITLAANGLELHCEIGTDINGTTGVPLTITANGCKVIGAHFVPDDGQIGCVISGDYNYMELCNNHTTGTSGWQVTTAGTGNQFVKCIASNFTGAGWDIKGPNNTFYLCSAVGEGGTETGFHLSNTAAHRNMFYQCATIDCATAGWDCDAGADDNLFVQCTDSDGCGTLVDAGANNAWRDFRAADILVANITHWGGTAVTVSATTALPEVDAKSISDDAAAANALELFVETLSSGAFTTSTFGANCLVAASIATDVHAETADAVWDEVITGHDGAGKAGQQLWTDLDAVLIDTAQIGAAGAGLSDLGGMSTAMKAEVQVEANDAIVANNLDHWMLEPVADRTDMTAEVVDDTVCANMMTKTDGDTSDFDPTSDSLEAIADGAVEAGAYSCTITVRTTGETAIEGALVWPSLNAKGTPAYAGYQTTANGGKVTFWLADNDYYFYAMGAGYTYDNSDNTLTVNGVGVNATFDIGTAVSGNVGGASSTSFLTRMVEKIRLETDEPSTNAKYGDSVLYGFIQEAYVSILGDVQRNRNTQTVSKYTFTYSSDTEMYALPATVGTVKAIGQEDDTSRIRFFYEKGGQLSEYGSGVSLEGNFVRVQPGAIEDASTVTVWYLADGSATLFNAASTTFDTTSITFGTLNAGTRDVRPYAYVGSKIRVLNDTVNLVQQERIISTQSGDEYEKYTVDPAFSPELSTPVEFEIVPDFPATMDAVVAVKVAMHIVGIEGDVKRHRLLTLKYQDHMRTLTLSSAHKDFQQGALRRRDGYQSSRGSRPTNRPPGRVF